MMLYLFGLFIAIQLGYFFFFFRRFFSLGGRVIAPKDMRPISIIICAKNESENLRNNLPVVLMQNYADAQKRPIYEVIVVNDCSSDNTIAVLEELKQNNPNLKVLNNNGQGKKAALATGVAAAQHEWLAMIDADCCPVSKIWLLYLAEPFARGKEISLGYGGYYKTAGILNTFILWETMHTFLQYSTYATAGMPYMAVGRNMACMRQTLINAMQHPLWNVLASGDDDMLVRIAGNKHNTAVVQHQNSYTYTHAKATWPEWVNQKQRHLSTGKYYKWHVQLLLAGYGMAHAGMWVTFFAALIEGDIKATLIIMAARCLFYWWTWGVAFTLLNRIRTNYVPRFNFRLIVFDFGWMIYNFAFLPYIAFKNKKNWK